MKFHIMALLVLVSFQLVGCATSAINREQVDAIHKGMDQRELNLLMGEAKPKFEFELEHERDSYIAKTYKLKIGTETQIIMICAPVCIPVPSEVPVYEDYMIMQHSLSEELLAWGAFEKLSKDSNEIISSLMPIAKERIKELEKEAYEESIKGVHDL